MHGVIRLRKEVVPLIFVEPPKEPEEPAPVEPADTSQASKKRKPKQRVKAFTSQVEVRCVVLHAPSFIDSRFFYRFLDQRTQSEHMAILCDLALTDF